MKTERTSKIMYINKLTWDAFQPTCVFHICEKSVNKAKISNQF